MNKYRGDSPPKAAGYYQPWLLGKGAMPKRKSEYIHFKWRLKDRYGLKSNIDASREIVDYIKSGIAKLIRRDSNTRVVWELPLTRTLKRINPDSKVQRITVVYDTKRKVLVSAGEILKANESPTRSRSRLRTRRTLEDLINFGEVE